MPSWVYDTPEVMNHVLDELSAFERELPGPKSPRARRRPPGQQLPACRRRAGVGRLAAGAQGQPVARRQLFHRRRADGRRAAAADRDLVEHYRQRLVATGADGRAGRGRGVAAVHALARVRHARRGSATSTSGASAAVSRWCKRQFTALEDYDTVGLLTRGKRPRRPFVPGEGALQLAPALAEEMAGRPPRRPGTSSRKV